MEWPPQLRRPFRESAGLYEVMPDVYQVPGFDLANISLIKGKSSTQ